MLIKDQISKDVQVSEEKFGNIKPSIIMRFMGTISLIISSTWLLYFSLILIYQLLNPSFIESLSISSTHLSYPITYIFLNTILSFAVIISIILSLKFNIWGVYLLLISIILLGFNELFLGNSASILYLIVFIVYLLVILLSYRKFRKKRS